MSNSVSVPTLELNEVECVANDISSHIPCTSNGSTLVSVCNKCIQLEIELQKVKLSVTKLQKRCSDKAAEIKRLKAAEKRSRLAKCSLVDMVQELKQRKLITAEGQDVLNVI